MIFFLQKVCVIYSKLIYINFAHISNSINSFVNKTTWCDKKTVRFLQLKLIIIKMKITCIQTTIKNSIISVVRLKYKIL